MQQTFVNTQQEVRGAEGINRQDLFIIVQCRGGYQHACTVYKLQRLSYGVIQWITLKGPIKLPGREPCFQVGFELCAHKSSRCRLKIYMSRVVEEFPQDSVNHRLEYPRCIN